jgi:hypothetical protein
MQGQCCDAMILALGWKSAQMPGGVTHPVDGLPGAERGLIQVRRSERQSTRGARPQDGSPQMGLFQQTEGGT